MIAKFPYYTHLLEDGGVDYERKDWLVVGDVQRVNIRAKQRAKWKDVHTDIGVVLPTTTSDTEVCFRVALLHLPDDRTLSVAFDGGVFLCNSRGKTIDRFD